MNNRISHIDALRAHGSSHCLAFCLLVGAFASFSPQTASGQQPALTKCVSLTPATLSLAESSLPGEYDVTLLKTSLQAGETVYVVPTVAQSSASVELSLSPKQMQFTDADFPQGGGVPMKKFSVGVRPDDDAVGGTVEINHAVLFAGCESEGGTVTVTVTDSGPPVPGVTVSKTELILAEASATTNPISGEYTLSLASYPSGDVAVEIKSSDAGAADATPKKLTFTQDNWFTPQTVTVAPVDDADGAEENVTISHKATGGGYDAVSIPDLKVRVIDLDPAIPVPGVTVSESKLELHEGQSTTYTLTLDTDPVNPVVILAQSSNNAAAHGLPVTLQFSAGALTTNNVDTHWSTPHVVTVQAPDDPNAFSEEVTISHTVVATGDYAGLVIPGVVVKVWDDEARSVTLSELALVMDEGKEAGYTVVLGSLPLSTVVVTPTSSVPDKVSVTPSSLRFTTANWNEPQEIVLKALRDADSNADTATITHKAADGGYNDVQVADLTVVVNDTGTVTSAEDAEDTLPSDFTLEENYPNPFNPFTEIAYSLPRQAHVTLTVYDTAGREVDRLVSASQPAGRYQVRWDGTDAQGAPVRSGVYFYRLATEDWRETQSMVLLK